MARPRDKTLNDGDTNEFPVVWREEKDGLAAEIVYEQDDTSIGDPRQSDCNLGIMVGWHPDYYIGDYQITDGSGHGAVKHRFESDDYTSIGDLARRLVEEENAVAVIPLYLYDHSGISISAGSGYVGRGDTASGGYDEFGNARGWDTTLCGVIYTTRERIEEFCGKGEDGALYCPRDWEGTPEAWIVKNLREEVELYDRYLRGEVYFYRVVDEDDDYLDSCGGYLPDVGVPIDEELDYVKEEARAALEAEVEDRRKKASIEHDEATRAANLNIATESA